ncbi:MAG: hypothetical protein NT133_07845 [Alphaproteobacteria bacterium]|nr:hypothetical protein [Alphaproteobacteria bacterium]
MAVNPEIFLLDSEAVRRLQDDLYRTRRDIVELMPEVIANIMRSYVRVETRSDYYDWEKDVSEFVLGITQVDLEISHLQPRARCPLCRSGGFGPYEVGFLIPEGLRRHLHGSASARQCAVTRAAFALAQNYLAERFTQTDRDLAQHLETRRRTERVYDIGPKKANVLFDEGLSGTALRDDCDFRQADARLKELGFERKETGNVVSYRQLRNGFEIWADPRQTTRLDFTVCPPVIGRARRREVYFYMLDSWRNDIVATFGRQFEKAISKLPPPGSRHKS